MPQTSSTHVLRGWIQKLHLDRVKGLSRRSLYLGLAIMVMVSTVALPAVHSGLGDLRKTWRTAGALFDQVSAIFGRARTPGTADAPAVALAIPATAESNVVAALPPRARHTTLPCSPRPGVTASDPQFTALCDYISRKYKVAHDTTSALVRTTYKVGGERRMDPLLLLAVMAVESRYDPLAESSHGAQGLMQVMTSIHHEKFRAYGKRGPLDPVANINVGATILKDCIARRGSINAGLACYVGATGPNDNGYSAKVLAERHRLAQVSGITIARD